MPTVGVLCRLSLPGTPDAAWMPRVAFSFRGATTTSEHRRLRDCALARDAAAALEAHVNDCVRFTLVSAGWAERAIPA